MLRQVCVEVYNRGYAIENIDATVIAQAPKLKPYIEQMRNNLAQACKININQINVKATTEEHLGFTGRKEGIAVHAVCFNQIVKTSLFCILCNKNKEVIFIWATPLLW